VTVLLEMRVAFLEWDTQEPSATTKWTAVYGKTALEKRHKFSKVLYIMALHHKYTKALNFENLCQGEGEGGGGAAACERTPSSGPRC